MKLKGKVVLDSSLEGPAADPVRAAQDFSADDFIRVDEAGPVLPGDLRPGRRHLLWWAGLGLMLGLLVLHSAIGLWQTWQQSQLLGAAWSLALGLLAMAALGAVIRELRLLRRLARVSRHRERAEQLLQQQGEGRARTFCEQLAREAGLDSTDAYQGWQAGLAGHELDVEVLTLYSRQVLSVQDRQARGRVLKWSGEAAVMVAASPLAVVDMLLVLWRNLKMIEDITGCYGIRLGYWSRLRLLRRILHHMLYVGVSEAAIDMGMDLLGLELAGRLSARAGQGVGAGLLTARLGLQTISLCRPVPWQGDERKQLGGIRKALFDKVSRMLTGNRG
ncbi:TIGR01620 family protein [Zobellella aerophila]|uniref:TIGR01620 family protein n=1 Tax=Zobellella aerophila TaxID=870480 RepID=A0ABP6V4D3_9GAMM